MSLQVAFLTGQSDPHRCALSPEQQQFLVAINVDPEERVTQNFPYDPDTLAWQHTPLWAASVANAQQMLASRRDGFAKRYRPALNALLERRDCTLVLAGSCGLELWQRIAPSPRLRSRAVLVAYGPVAGSRPTEVALVAQGRRDWVSRLGYNGSVDLSCECGHMNYLAAQPLQAAVASLVTALRNREAA